MVQGTIDKKDLKKLIAEVTEDGRFYGAAQGSEGIVLSELGPDDEVLFEYANLKLPLKRAFFPHSDEICTFGEKATPVSVSDQKRVIFGVRPCDALSLLYLDKVFLDGEFADPYYKSKRDRTVVISLACSTPSETCFCTSVGGSPAGRDGADVLAFDIGDRLLFETATDKGKAFLQAHAGLFGKPKAEALKARDDLAARAEKAVGGVDVSDITERLREGFDSAIWDEIAQRCLGCGVCTYSCPTCHCFGLHDEQTPLGTKRIRVQDACLFPSFTLEASGHNPRATPGARMRQRIMHKFRYTVENFGDIFCVGCGRCISSCPVNIDLRETIAEVAR